MNPFTPTPDQRRGRKRTLAGLVLFLLAAATLAAAVWPWAEGLGWAAWLRSADGDEVSASEPTVRGFGWWCSVLRLHLGLFALVLLLPALLTNRRLSAVLAGLALVVNGFVVAATPVRGGWIAAAEAAWSGPAEGGGWTVLHVHLAGADRIDTLAGVVAEEQPEAVTAAGARPGVPQSITPQLDGYRLAGSRPADGDAGLAVWVRRDVISGAARPAGPDALAADLERADGSRLRLLVCTASPPAPDDDADAPRLVVGGFGFAPWSGDLPGASGGKLLPPGHLRPWPPPLDHAWAALPTAWTASTTAAPALSDDAFPLHRPLLIHLTAP